MNKIWLVLAAVSALSLVSHAQTQQGGNNYGGGPQLTDLQYKDKKNDNITACGGTPGQPLNKDVAICLTNRMNGGGDNAQQTCNQQITQLQTSTRDFYTACEKAKISGGAQGCATTITKCQGLGADSDDDTYDYKHHGDDDTAAITATGKKRIQVVPDSETATSDFTQCPPLAKEGLKSYQDDYEKSRDKVNQLQDKLSEATDALNDMDTKYQSDNNDMQNKMEKAQNDATDQIQKLQSGLKDEQRQMAENIAKINAQITALNNQISAQDVALANNSQKLATYRTTALDKCHQDSLAKVADLRKQKLALMSQDLYSAGGMNNLLKSVGLDSRTQAQRLTQSYDSNCQNDASYLNGISLAQQQYALDNKAVNTTKAGLQAQIRDLNNQIGQIQAQLPQDANEAMQKMLNVQQRLQQEETNLQTQMTNARQAYVQKRMTKMQDLQRLQQQLQEEQDYLTQKQSYLAVANKYAHGSTAPDGAYDDAAGKYGAYQSAAESAITSCCFSPNLPSSPQCQTSAKALCGQDAACVKAKTDSSVNGPAVGAGAGAGTGTAGRGTPGAR